MPKLRNLGLIVAGTVLASTLAAAQHAPPGGGHGGTHGGTHIGSHGGHAAADSGPVSGPFSLAVYGAFRRMIQLQDFAPKVQLKSVMHSGATEAIGAASGLRGEITVIAGKLLLTYGNPCPSCGAPGDDHATLLAAAKISSWQEPVAIASNLSGSALDGFIIARAKETGLDVSKPFPIRMKGTLSGVRMHVIRAFNPGFKGHGSGHAMADQEDIEAERIEGEVVGFYAPPSAQGIITHPGEPFHYHWVDMKRTRTAHLDAFGMLAGATLLLPKS